jgi:VanZ family protein
MFVMHPEDFLENDKNKVKVLEYYILGNIIAILVLFFVNSNAFVATTVIAALVALCTECVRAWLARKEVCEIELLNVIPVVIGSFMVSATLLVMQRVSGCGF